MLALALMLFAYTVGVTASHLAKQTLDPSHVLVDRSFLLIPALPMWIVAKRLRAGLVYPLKVGDWSAACDLSLLPVRTWAAALGPAVLFLALPSLVFFQLSVQFEPVTTGRLWPLLPKVLSLSALNGLAEELLFRGFLMVPLVGLLGARSGIWLQALFFAIHHWGASPGLLAGLPVALLVTLLGLLLGRSALATGGIGWAVALHACLVEIPPEASVSRVTPSATASTRRAPLRGSGRRPRAGATGSGRHRCLHVALHPAMGLPDRGPDLDCRFEGTSGRRAAAEGTWCALP